MPKGIAVPMRVGPNGGTVLTDSDDNDNKIILLALGDGDSESAFQQDISLGSDFIFDVADPSNQASVEGRVRSIFATFQTQRRFRLLPETIRWVANSEDQTTTLSFKYLNLESDEPQEYTQTFTN